MESLARPNYTFRGERRNAMTMIEKVARAISVGTGASSYSDRHTRLETEQRLKAIKRAGVLPSPATKEGAYVRALLAQLAPKIGPGKRSIHTLHRKIAIAEQRRYPSPGMSYSDQMKRAGSRITKEDCLSTAFCTSAQAQ